MEIPEELVAALEGPARELTSLPGVNGVGLGPRVGLPVTTCGSGRSVRES